ncbi:Aste57867_12464 [Aphanomyces stellatus]|uniref:Aste57867_12464 protein n=1 Tax=Aphanomyces stellatus TaxID=120398 RepID=A0A485KX08_9STRA|nr:hypothetical protein As57867_012418 [Aphanomyces stellatus]VFT89315.1 Aste57867_12464 [Aphanomyces stellatus]
MVRRRRRSHRFASMSGNLHKFPWDKLREKDEFHGSTSEYSKTSHRRRRHESSLSSTASTALQQSMMYYITPTRPEETFRNTAHASLDDSIISHISRASKADDRFRASSTESSFLVVPCIRPSSDTKDSILPPASIDNDDDDDDATSRDSGSPSAIDDSLVFTGLVDTIGLTMQKEALETDVRQLRRQLYAAKRDARRRARLDCHRRAAASLLADDEVFLAQLELKHALRVDDTCASTWHLLADCLLRLGRHEEAALACHGVLELARTAASVALLGRIRLAQGRPDDAIHCFHEALRLDDGLS